MGLTRSFNFEDARGRVDGETVALGIVFAGHPVVEGILIFAVEIAIELHHPGGELRGPLRLGIKHERWAPGSAMPTNRLWRPPGRQQMAVSSTAPPRRTRSAELGRTAPPAVAPRHWCGDAGTSAAAPTVSQRSQRRCPFPLLWHWFREALSAHRVEAPATKATGLRRLLPKTKKQKESTKTRCRHCRALVCWLLVPWPRLTPRLWQLQKRIRRNGAHVHHGVPKAFRWELANVFNAALVAKVLKGRGHLDVEKVG